jgi:hypothetical protein
MTRSDEALLERYFRLIFSEPQLFDLIKAIIESIEEKREDPERAGELLVFGVRRFFDLFDEKMDEYHKLLKKHKYLEWCKCEPQTIIKDDDDE